MPRIGLLILAAILATPPARGAATQDESSVRSAGLATDGASLLAYLRQRIGGPVEPERLASLIRALASADPTTARKACAELLAIGPAAVPLLRQAAKDVDAPEAASLACHCLRHLESNPGVLTVAVVRLIAVRQPPGAAAVLLDFFPHAEDEGVREEVRAALASVAYRDGKAEPAMPAALEDPLVLRRAAAVEALCQGGNAEPRATLRKLLRDPSPSVRLRAALALAQARDPQAVSTLIALLPEGPLEQARLAEEFLADLAAEKAPRATLGEDAASRRRCRDEWDAWWRASDGPGLLDDLRKRTLTEANRVKSQTLIRQLGDDDFTVREKAVREIRKTGGTMLPLLRQAARSGDLEVKQRAAECLAEMERDASLPLSPVVARLVALRQPKGAAEAVLAFLPFAEDEGIAQELQTALNAVVAHDGKTDPAILAALKDPAPARRAAAAEALCQVPGGEHLPAVRPLLKDADPTVRLKAALALAGAREREAVPVLIALVGELPAAQAALAEDYLLRLTRDRPPADLPSGDSEARRKRRDLWAEWWGANGARVELVVRYAAPAERSRGQTLLVQPEGNQVVEVGADGKVRWKLTGLLGPYDAEVLGRDRVLVAEYNGQRVTERNLKGDVLWQKQTPDAYPVGVQRLRNGNTLIVCYGQPPKILEVDRTGRELYSIVRNDGVTAARKLRDGSIVCVTSQRTVLRLDTAGKERKSFPVPAVKSFTVPAVADSGVDILPNGHVLVCVNRMNKVLEYDGDGKVTWEASVPWPMAACRLPGGGALAAVHSGQPQLLELNREGKTVGEVPTDSNTFRLRRR
jgi:HEAT repeat protein